jgi:molybdopterin converting factor small subunit
LNKQKGIAVTVTLVGSLKNIAKTEKTQLKIRETNSTVASVVRKLGEQFGQEFKNAIMDPELNDPKPRVLILKNNVEISALQGVDTPIRDKDKIVIIPIYHGG